MTEKILEFSAIIFVSQALLGLGVNVTEFIRNKNETRPVYELGSLIRIRHLVIDQ